MVLVISACILSFSLTWNLTCFHVDHFFCMIHDEVGNVRGSKNTIVIEEVNLISIFSNPLENLKRAIGFRLQVPMMTREKHFFRKWIHTKSPPLNVIDLQCLLATLWYFSFCFIMWAWACSCIFCCSISCISTKLIRCRQIK